jgi:hypothetical protein
MGEAKRRKQLTANAVTGSAAGVDGWRLSNQNTALELEEWFRKRGIDPSLPGIHDLPEFLKVEAQDPSALNMVARLVEARTYSAEELQLAERKIQVAAEAISNQVAQDGRLGQCVVASSVLSRCLDELGVWNYTAKTSLTIRFPPGVSSTPQYFYTFDEGDFVAAHAVVVAPPFAVIDLTIRHQHYRKPGLTQRLPAMVCSKEFQAYRMQAQELVSPSLIAYLRTRGYPSAQAFLQRERPDMLRLMEQLPSREVTFEGSRLSYGIVAVGGYPERLSEIHSHNAMINGLTPVQIFENEILPKLSS